MMVTLPFSINILIVYMKEQKAITMNIGLDRKQLTHAIYSTLAANDMRDGAHIRLMVTRARFIRIHAPLLVPRLSSSSPSSRHHARKCLREA